MGAMTGKAWLELALDGGGRVWGFDYTKKECYIRSLELDPECASAWHNLGVQCGGRLGGREFTSKECYVCSLACDPKCSGPRAWRNMECRGRVAGKDYAPKECYIRALELDPNCALAWNSLGVEGGGQIGNVTHTKKQCYIRSIELDPESARAWNNLGAEGGGRVSIVEGSLDFNQKECYIRALELDPTLISATQNLGNLIGREQRVERLDVEHRNRELHDESMLSAMRDPSSRQSHNESHGRLLGGQGTLFQEGDRNYDKGSQQARNKPQQTSLHGQDYDRSVSRLARNSLEQPTHTNNILADAHRSSMMGLAKHSKARDDTF